MNLGDLVEQHLSVEASAIIKSVGQIAADLNQLVYLVGGAVRDVLLARSSTDLDFVTEGSGIELAQAVQEQHGGELTTHERFGTAVWTPPSELFAETIDFITARKEVYAHPAALPDVTPSTMHDDLFRRDFTINALAVPLVGNNVGAILDLYGGQTDLENGLIRVLHPQSFSDDPTRIFRALRYAGRLDFSLEKETALALKNSLEQIGLLSADRLRHEFEKIFAEPNPQPILELLNRFGVMAKISNHIGWNNNHHAAFETLKTVVKTKPGSIAVQESGMANLRLLAWICASAQPSKVADELAETLNLSADLRQDLKNILQFSSPDINIAADGKPGSIEKAFRHFNETQLAILQIVDFLPHQIKDSISTYFTQWRQIKTFSDGNTLRQLGIPPGPIYKKILDELIAAKLNGEVTTEQDELDLIKAIGEIQ